MLYSSRHPLSLDLSNKRLFSKSIPEIYQHHHNVAANVAHSDEHFLLSWNPFRISDFRRRHIRAHHLKESANIKSRFSPYIGRIHDG